MEQSPNSSSSQEIPSILPRKQEPTLGPYPKSDESSSCPATLVL
jgi:hypothetical protein